ncbi:hypothetical protein AAEX28_04200 [Lentisphaerota bacterium WC36G]|nr:hypothetical protein LJT99_07070 [Lentisphaerae bacterium WC36]
MLNKESLSFYFNGIKNSQTETAKVVFKTVDDKEIEALQSNMSHEAFIAKTSLAENYSCTLTFNSFENNILLKENDYIILDEIEYRILKIAPSNNGVTTQLHLGID